MSITKLVRILERHSIDIVDISDTHVTAMSYGTMRDGSPYADTVRLTPATVMAWLGY